MSRRRRGRRRALNRRNYDKAYLEIRAYVMKRDRHRCQFTNCENRATQVHHIVRYADAPALRANRMNLISLCKGCHDKIKNKEKIFAPIFMMKVVENQRKYDEDHEDNS